MNRHFTVYSKAYHVQTSEEPFKRVQNVVSVAGMLYSWVYLEDFHTKVFLHGLCGSNFGAAFGQPWLRYVVESVELSRRL